MPCHTMIMTKVSSSNLYVPIASLIMHKTHHLLRFRSMRIYGPAMLLTVFIYCNFMISLEKMREGRPLISSIHMMNDK